MFRDEAARHRLNAIVHPRVRAEEAEFAARWSGEPGSVVVTDAALLVESGLHLRFDRLVVVHCPPEVQLARLMARDGIDEDAARARIDAQMPIDEKRRFAHFEVVDRGHAWTRPGPAARGPGRRDPEPGVTATSAERPPGSRPALGCLTHGPREGPRGLSPLRCSSRRSRGRGSVQMERLKAPSRRPAFRGPGIARPADPESGPVPATLAGALVLWQLSRGIADEGTLLAAMASVARLTHRSPAAIGNACVLALALLAAASPAAATVPLADRLARWRSQAARWAGGSFPDEIGPC